MKKRTGIIPYISYPLSSYKKASTVPAETIINSFKIEKNSRKRQLETTSKVSLELTTSLKLGG